MSAETIRKSAELEAAVIGDVLADNRTIATVQTHVGPGDFYHPMNACAFELILELDKKRMRVDEVSLAQAMRGRKVPEESIRTFLVEVQFHAIGGDAETHARQLAELADARRMEAAAARFLGRARSADVSVASLRDAFTAAMSEGARVRDDLRPVTMEAAATEFADRIAEIRKRGPGITGLTTGLSGLDDSTGGLGPGQLIIVAARPAMGKTSLCLGMALAAARKGKRVLFFSLEMRASELFARLACSEARVDYGAIKHGNITDETEAALLGALEKLRRLPIIVIDSGETTIHDIRAQSRRLAAEGGLAAVFVDYLQIVKVSREDRHDSRDQDVGEISRSLKSLANELGLPVVALSQLNRSCESRNDKRPMLSDLRDSGAIEQDADIVAFIYRDEVYNRDTAEPGVAEIILAKQRAGDTGAVKVRWVGWRTTFEDLHDPGRDASARMYERHRALDAQRSGQ